jgi:hypothetical protein
MENFPSIRTVRRGKIMKFIEWVINNKEWVFSGLGVAILAGIVGMLSAKDKGSVSPIIGGISHNQGTSIIINSPNAKILNQNSKINEDEKLELVDIRQLNNGSIDFLLRNPGKSVTYLKRIYFYFRLPPSSWSDNNYPCMSMGMPSHYYDYDIYVFSGKRDNVIPFETEKRGDEKEKDKFLEDLVKSEGRLPWSEPNKSEYHWVSTKTNPLYTSQYIKANEIDRFQVKLSMVGPEKEKGRRGMCDAQRIQFDLPDKVLAIAAIEYNTDGVIYTQQIKIVTNLLVSRKPNSEY